LVAQPGKLKKMGGYSPRDSPTEPALGYSFTDVALSDALPAQGW